MAYSPPHLGFPVRRFIPHYSHTRLFHIPIGAFLTRFFFAFIIFIVVFSRLYLGVHFPLDVLCGFAIGIIFLVIYFESIESILTISRKIPPFADFLAGGVLICLFYFNLPRTYEIQELYFLTVGVLFGTCLRNYYPFPFAEKGITAVIVVFLIGVIFLSYFLLPPSNTRLFTHLWHLSV